MALAILFENSDVLFLDSVQNYNKSRRSNISTHPVDQSSTITDHVAKQNLRMEVKGVISSADFQQPEQRSQEILDNTDYSIDNAFNNPVGGAEIKQRSNLLEFLPGSVQQFLGSGAQSTVTVDEFRGYSHETARDRIERAYKNSEKLTILDHNIDTFIGRPVSIRAFQNILIADYKDMESVDTGDALEFSFVFEQVRFASIKETDVSINQAPSSEVADETSQESNEGDQTGESVDAQLRAIEQGSQNFEEFTSDLFGTDVSDNAFFKTGPGDLFEGFQ